MDSIVTISTLAENSSSSLKPWIEVGLNIIGGEWFGLGCQLCQAKTLTKLHEQRIAGKRVRLLLFSIFKCNGFTIILFKLKNLLRLRYGKSLFLKKRVLL